MITINVEFIRFADLHIGDLFGAVGVYVLWDARAIARPTYIGEGNILKRLGDHSHRDERKFARPVDGCVAILGGKDRQMSKVHSQAVERLLLDVAGDIDCVPSHNRKAGAASVVHLLCDAEPTLRVKVTGHDPFFHPRSQKPIASAKEIRARSRVARAYEVIKHDWHLRRLRASIA